MKILVNSQGEVVGVEPAGGYKLVQDGISLERGPVEGAPDVAGSVQIMSQASRTGCYWVFKDGRYWLVCP